VIKIEKYTKNIMIYLILSALTLFMYSCYSNEWEAGDGEVIVNTDQAIVIRDQTGRNWDFTHAANNYNMNPAYFNYGIGIGAIPSVDNPVIINSDDQGYPDDGNSITVFGVSHNDEARAYPVVIMNRHEVFNETYPGEDETKVAVAY
jgi:hypothetical protein